MHAFIVRKVNQNDLGTSARENSGIYINFTYFKNVLP